MATPFQAALEYVLPAAAHSQPGAAAGDAERLAAANFRLFDLNAEARDGLARQQRAGPGRASRGRVGPPQVTVDLASATPFLTVSGPSDGTSLAPLSLESAQGFSSCRANTAVVSGKWQYEVGRAAARRGSCRAVGAGVLAGAAVGLPGSAANGRARLSFLIAASAPAAPRSSCGPTASCSWAGACATRRSPSTTASATRPTATPTTVRPGRLQQAPRRRLLMQTGLGSTARANSSASLLERLVRVRAVGTPLDRRAPS